jgi:hypothetical protein
MDDLARMSYEVSGKLIFKGMGMIKPERGGGPGVLYYIDMAELLLRRGLARD